MEILYNFGFEPILFFAQIVNFLIIFFLLKKFMYKPLLKVLHDRKKKIEEGLKNAEEAEKRLAESVQKEEEILRKAQIEAKKLMDEALSQKELMLKEAEDETKEKVASMIADATSQIREETKVASQNLEKQVSKLAIEFLEHSIKGLFGEKEQKEIMKSALSKIKTKK